MGNPEQMQQAMSQMMNNPMMQSVLSDPDMIRNMFQSNPAIQQASAHPDRFFKYFADVL